MKTPSAGKLRAKQAKRCGLKRREGHRKYLQKGGPLSDKVRGNCFKSVVLSVCRVKACAAKKHSG